MTDRIGENTEKSNFVMNVEMDADGSVHVASYNNSGSHWGTSFIGLILYPHCLIL